MRKLCLAVIVILFLSLPGSVIANEDVTEVVRQYVDENQREIIDELIKFLRLPNNAENLADIQKNALFIGEMLRNRGLEAQILELETAPLVVGSYGASGNSRTLLLYAHYDGQAVDPESWTGTDPFEPTLRDRSLEEGGRLIPYPESGRFENEWRLYARSSADDKSPIVGMLTAFQILRSKGIPITSNLKFIFEGEEEAGSTHLGSLLMKYRDKLEAEALIVSDGPVFLSGQPTLYFGARGIVTIEITVFGPSRHLHSGHFGNWAPNPGSILSELLASMKDRQGRVLVNGFYDDVVPLSPEEEAYLRDVPDIGDKLAKEFGVSRSEGGRSLMEAINLPSLNVRGLSSGWVGDQARTIVPSTATASIDLRLVKGIDPEEQVERVVRHIRKMGFKVLERDPTEEDRRQSGYLAKVVSGHGYAAHRTPLDLPLCLNLIAALEKAHGDVVKLPTLGGSVPLHLFSQNLGLETIVGVPVVNQDNNQHSPDENLRLGNFFQGIETFAAIMSME